MCLDQLKLEAFKKLHAAALNNHLLEPAIAGILLQMYSPSSLFENQLDSMFGDVEFDGEDQIE
jgi:hypothetical protein